MAASTDFPSYNYQMSGQGFGGGSQLYGSSPYQQKTISLLLHLSLDQVSRQLGRSEPWKRAPMRALAWDESTGSSE